MHHDAHMKDTFTPIEWPTLLKPSDVAEILGVPEATLANWRYRREGPIGFRVGRHVRYLKSDVETWINEQRSKDQSATSDGLTP
jgi:predicted DNA-binding transcriptional regulator AlpA